MPPASASSAHLRRRAESLAALAACANAGADQLMLLYPEVGEPRVQAALERALDGVHDLLSSVVVAATELGDDLALLAGRAASADGPGAARVDTSGSQGPVLR